MTCPVSQLFILAPNGHAIVYRDFRGELPKDTSETFFRELVEKGANNCPPVFQVEGVSFIAVKCNGLHFLCTSVDNVCPSLIISLLTQLTKVCKDYLGVLSEEALRKNFTLIYEITDEALDYGYPQHAATTDLQPYLFNRPIPVDAPQSVASVVLPSFKHNPKTMASAAAHKSVVATAGSSSAVSALAGWGRSSASGGAGNEIFIDLVDRISALITADGQVRSFSVDGCIQMKSFLKGSPQVHLALNEDLVIASTSAGGRAGGAGAGGAYGAVSLDDVNFHECVGLERFESEKVLTLSPPSGEFVVMNFRIGTLRSERQLPFRLWPTVHALSDQKRELQLTVKADFPDKLHAVNVRVTFTLPKSVASATVQLPAAAARGTQSATYTESSRLVDWQIKKWAGGAALSLSTKMSVGASVDLKKEMGPISMAFEIPSYNVSQLAVRHLHIIERDKSYKPHRWVRCLTHASSYCCRI
jgi:AP-4 complex subunit mu-1